MQCNAMQYNAIAQPNARKKKVYYAQFLAYGVLERACHAIEPDPSCLVCKTTARQCNPRHDESFRFLRM